MDEKPWWAYELKACPFCGGKAEMRKTSSWDFYVKCTNPGCGARTKNCHDNEPGAAMCWNERVGEEG